MKLYTKFEQVHKFITHTNTAVTVTTQPVFKVTVLHFKTNPFVSTQSGFVLISSSIYPFLFLHIRHTFTIFSFLVSGYHLFISTNPLKYELALKVQNSTAGLHMQQFLHFI
ncbi:hypothetical protein FQA47_019068 [Oryzias melastigma]|uniref:Uncharacterized protein n=1 Tax=Oryzias melastigma TaxID=30732 RepID=A0A834KYK3_ORYME|nr:hypothetical protein FQA47_019068 [Oryzias melastigma]